MLYRRQRVTRAILAFGLLCATLFVPTVSQAVGDPDIPGCTKYIIIYENDNGIFGGGDQSSICAGTHIANMVGYTSTDFGWHGGCSGAYYPVTYNYWNNCVSAFTAVGLSTTGTSVCFYDGLNFTGSVTERWVTDDDLRNTGWNDKIGSIKWITSPANCP